MIDSQTGDFIPDARYICRYDDNGICHAKSCRSDQKCNSRDVDGNPRYD